VEPRLPDVRHRQSRRYRELAFNDEDHLTRDALRRRDAAIADLAFDEIARATA
jgi:hypothetical protein